MSAKSPRKSFGGGDRCQACGLAVYSVERLQAAKFVYHKKCLKCSACQNCLSPNSVFWLSSGAAGEITGSAEEMRCRTQYAPRRTQTATSRLATKVPHFFPFSAEQLPREAVVDGRRLLLRAHS